MAKRDSETVCRESETQSFNVYIGATENTIAIGFYRAPR